MQVTKCDRCGGIIEKVYVVQSRTIREESRYEYSLNKGWELCEQCHTYMVELLKPVKGVK